jgi:hypothetical protein
MIYALWLIFRGKVTSFMSILPRWVWIALTVVIAVGSAYWFYERQIHKAYEHGKSDSDAQWVITVNELHTATQLWKSAYESKSIESSVKERQRHEQELIAIDSRAVDLRLHGPGKASFVCGPGTGASVSNSAGGHEQSLAGSDATVASVPPEQALAVVPWDELVTYASGADALRDEVITWRNWYKDQKELRDKAIGDLPKVPSR